MSQGIQSYPSSPTVRYKAARQEREISFNVHQLSGQAAERARLFIEEFPATQKFWSTHCVVCFVAHKSFNYARSACTGSRFIGSVVATYRRVLGNKWGKGQCWFCLMPANCCPRWNIDGTGKTRTQPLAGVVCEDKFAIRDTWACIWEDCPKARDVWIQHARRNGIQDWSPGVPDNYSPAFAQYFQSVVDFGDDYKVGRICFDLNWLTQTYFIGDNCNAYNQLLGR